MGEKSEVIVNYLFIHSWKRRFNSQHHESLITLETNYDSIYEKQLVRIR